MFNFKYLSLTSCLTYEIIRLVGWETALEASTMPNCKWCNQPFIEVKVWQIFCSGRCCQDWHLHQRKLERQEKLFDKLRRRDEVLARLNNGELAQLVADSRGTPDQRKQVSETLARLNGDGIGHDDAYREKWAAIRAEWAQEDEEDEREPKFVRRI